MIALLSVASTKEKLLANAGTRFNGHVLLTIPHKHGRFVHTAGIARDTQLSHSRMQLRNLNLVRAFNPLDKRKKYNLVLKWADHPRFENNTINHNSIWRYL
jgi:hypothetical protein